MTQHSFWFYGASFFIIILIRYVLMAGFAYWLVYLRGDLRAERFSGDHGIATARRAICQPAPEAMRDDIRLSVISTIVFALATAAVMMIQERGMTRLYGQVQDYPWWYLAVSYIAVLVLQDAWFYATHRLLHRPALFAWFHRGHHRSRQPTPWTSFAFDPLEAVLQALFLVAIVLVMPLHFITLMAVLTTMTVWAIVNHLGPDHLPLGFPHHWLGRWLIGPAHHSLHHRRHGVNFGLYFTFWDRLLGTEDPSYAAAIGAATHAQAR